MLPERIRALRRKLGMKQEDVAQALGCDRVTVSHYEHGRTTPPLYAAKKMAALFKVTLDELMGDETNEEGLPRYRGAKAS